jgi:hypothetical protein
MESNATARYRGEVVYIYAFDVAYDTARQPIRELLGQSVAQFAVDASKRSPRQLFFYKPQMVRLPPMERLGPLGPVRVERNVKLLPVGAISITVRVPFAVKQIEDLVAFHDLQFSNGSLTTKCAGSRKKSLPNLNRILSARNRSCRKKRLTRFSVSPRRFWILKISRLKPKPGFKRIVIRSLRCSRRKKPNAFPNKRPRNPLRVI